MSTFFDKLLNHKSYDPVPTTPVQQIENAIAERARRGQELAALMVNRLVLPLPDYVGDVTDEVVRRDYLGEYEWLVGCTGRYLSHYVVVISQRGIPLKHKDSRQYYESDRVDEDVTFMYTPQRNKRIGYTVNDRSIRRIIDCVPEFVRIVKLRHSDQEILEIEAAVERAKRGAVLDPMDNARIIYKKELERLALYVSTDGKMLTDPTEIALDRYRRDILRRVESGESVEDVLGKSK